MCTNGKQAEKLKSRKMNDVEWWKMKDDGLRILNCVLTDELTDGQTDICDCRVAFATEKEFWHICFLQQNLSTGHQSSYTVFERRWFEGSCWPKPSWALLIINRFWLSFSPQHNNSLT